MGLQRLIRSQRVADVDCRDPITLDARATLGEALRVMQTRAVGCVLATEGEALVGIFTERDVVRALAAGATMAAPLADHMSRNPTCVRSDDPLVKALGHMCRGGFRHLPIVDGAGKPIGSVSVKRALHHLGDLMPGAVYNLPPDPHEYPATAEGG